MSATEPQPSGDHIEVGDIKNAQAVAIGAGATAVYQGLTVEEVATLVVKLKHKDQPVVWNGRYPYIGLTAFQESDAQFFFGRESLVDDLLERVQKSRFITIAGPSGSGKSSVARAGLFHALRAGRLEKSDSWLLATMQPKGNPIEQLAMAINRMMARPDAGDYLRKNGRENPLALQEQIEPLLPEDKSQRCVLLVDQFEETFTQTKDEEERAAFINLLTTAVQAAEGRIIILLSLRSDFISHCARYPNLRSLMSQQFQLVGAMDPPDLAKAITLPALEVGAKIDPELVSRIMADMKGEPGALPLMSFALRDLFDAEKSTKGEPMDLLLPEYVARGGIESALERHANGVFDNFTDAQKGLARGVFSKLIEVGQGRADTRRTAALNELIPAGTEPEAVEAVVNALAKEGVRLITTSGDETTDGSSVTIAHEKLIDAWPWLRTLVDENRDMIIFQNQISQDAQMWKENKKNKGFLYPIGRLLIMKVQLNNQNLILDELSDEFIKSNLKNEKNKRIQRSIMYGILMLALIISPIIYINEQRVRAVSAQATAEAESIRAVSAQAIAEAESTRAVAVLATADANQTQAVESALALSLVANSWTLMSDRNTPNHIIQARLLAVEGAQLNQEVGRAQDQALSQELLQTLATENSDASLATNLELPELLALQCSLAGRNLSLAEWEQFLPRVAYRRTCAEWPSGEGAPADAPLWGE